MVYQELYLKSKWFSDVTPKNPKPATATLTFSGAIEVAETVTIGDDVFEFVATADDITEETNIPVVVGDVLTAENAVAKLTAAINAKSEIVTAVAVNTDETDAVVVSYIAVGTAGNSISVETDVTNASWGNDVTKLSGGQYGTPCPEVNSIVYVDPYYYWCDKEGNKDNVSWKRFIPATF